MKKLILGMVLGLTVISAASTKAEAKTYKVTDSNQGKVEKKVVNLINSKCMEKKNQKFTVKLTSKGKYANWNVTSISDDLAFEYQSSEARFVYPDKSKMKFDVDGIKSGKTKKLGKYVVATYKKSGKKAKTKVTVTYKITVKSNIIDRIGDSAQREAEYKAKAMAEIKANLIGDSEIAKVAAFFKFCQNKRELSGESYSDWEEFYKAPYKYAYDRKAHKDSKCYAEALKALGMTTKIEDYAKVKFQGKWYSILPDGQSLAHGSWTEDEDIIKPYVMDGVVRYTHGSYGSFYNEVKMFYGSDEWRKANDNLDKKYKALYDEAFANAETDSEYDALCEELDAKMQAEYRQIYKNKFPLLEENEDGTWTEESIALYDCYEMLNEKGTETFKLYVNQHDVELFHEFPD